jgi:hypothetical protein
MFANTFFRLKIDRYKVTVRRVDVKSGFSDPADFATTRTVRLKVHRENCHSSFKEPDLFIKIWIQPDRDLDPTCPDP